MIHEGEVDRRLQSLARHIQKLEEMSRLTIEQFMADEHLTASAERYLQLGCEACIEIGLLIISGLHLKQPDSYEQIPEILSAAGFGPGDYAIQIQQLMNTRNQLTHGYTGMTPIALHTQLPARLIDLHTFAKQATTFLRKVA